MTLVLPVKISYWMADLVADIKYFFSIRERREIVENLKLVLPAEDLKTLRRYSREICANFARYLVDFFRFPKVDMEYIKRHVEIVGREHIDEAQKNGKGAILLSAHIGSWELGGAVMGLLGYPFNAIVLDHKNKLVNRFFVNQRQMANEKVISAKFGLKKCFNALMNNELLAIVGDKDFTNRGVVVKFFGRDTLLPKGPASLSLKTGAAILTAATIRSRDDYFKLIFEKSIEYLPSGDYDTDLRALTERCAMELEVLIRKYPTQWYCFRRFWLQ